MTGTPTRTGDGITLCGAEAWRTFSVDGLIVSSAYRSALVVCGLAAGHPGQHMGWLGFKTGRGAVSGKVTW